MMAYFSPSMTMYSNKHGSNMPYNSWYPAVNYHHPSSNGQFLESDMSPHHQAAAAMYYNPHIFQTSPDWSHEFSAGVPQGLQAPPPVGGSSSSAVGHHQLSGSSGSAHNTDHLQDGLQAIPSPPVTVSGSEMSSPGAPNESASPQTALRPVPAKSPFQWLTKNPQPHTGKTRTKDKYRVVYTDCQRLELEKEYHTSRYITIRRKSELAQCLQLSERQVKIWFQNRRAKERKTDKKRTDPMSHSSAMAHQQNSIIGSGSGGLSNGLASHLDIKPKIEPGLHPHPLHQIGAMGMSMGMGSLSLHHPPLHHSQHYNLSLSPMSGTQQPSSVHQQHHQQQHQQHSLHQAQQQQQQQQQQQHQVPSAALSI